MSGHYRLLLILGALVGIGPLSIDMYLPAFGFIARDFQVTPAQVELSLTSFFLGLSLGQLFYGPLSDRFGRKRPLAAGLILYCAACLACTAARSIESLILFRFIQAVGACSGFVIARAVVRDLFDHRDSAKAFSLLMLIMGVGPICAPLLGGFLAQALGWRGIFLFCFTFALVCLTCSMAYLRETHAFNAEVRLSRVFSTYWSILKNREFMTYACAGSIAQAGMFAYITGSPFVFMETFGVSPASFAWIFGSNALGLITASQINARLLKFYHPDQIIRVTFKFVFLLAVGILASGVLGFGPFVLTPLLFVFLSVLGMTTPNTAAGAMSLQRNHAGSASALLGFIQFSAAALASVGVSVGQALVHESHSKLFPCLPQTSLLPMTVVVGICGMSAATIFWRGKKNGSERQIES